MQENLVESMKKVLVNTYLLKMQTQQAHWNITGIDFPQYHELFEKQYENLAAAIDEIAERLRYLGVYVDISLKTMQENKVLSNFVATNESKRLLSTLLDGHGEVEACLQQCMKIAAEFEDEVTVDLMVGRLAWHQKNIWILKSSLA